MSSQIFKLYLLNNNNEILNIHIYDINGDETNVSIYFNEDEYSNFQSKKIPIELHKQIIYNDDTIENIEYKMISNVSSDKNLNNYNLFYKSKQENIDYKKIFFSLKDENSIVNKQKFEIFLKNNNIQYEYDKTKEDFDLTTFLEIKQNEMYKYYSFNYEIDNKEIIIHPLLNNINYIQSVKSKKGNLLFENKKIHNNIIYGLHINEYFNYVKDHSQVINIENTLNIYFPELLQSNILTQKNVILHNDPLMKTLFKKYDKYNQLIDLHYSFYQEYQKQNIEKYKVKISSLQFVYYTKDNFIFPQEIFFKKIHSSKQLPFIKYNPGFKMENIYRLYTPNKDIYGKKIPYISKKKM